MTLVEKYAILNRLSIEIFKHQTPNKRLLRFNGRKKYDFGIK